MCDWLVLKNILKAIPMLVEIHPLFNHIVLELVHKCVVVRCVIKCNPPKLVMAG